METEKQYRVLLSGKTFSTFNFYIIEGFTLQFSLKFPLKMQPPPIFFHFNENFYFNFPFKSQKSRNYQGFNSSVVKESKTDKIADLIS